MPPLSETEIAARLAAAGIALPKIEQDDLRGAYAMLLPALEMIRGPAGIPPAAEPALTFAAGEK
jgi:2-keto-4-pentenoate hydratase